MSFNIGFTPKKSRRLTQLLRKKKPSSDETPKVSRSVPRVRRLVKLFESSSVHPSPGPSDGTPHSRCRRQTDDGQQVTPLRLAPLMKRSQSDFCIGRTRPQSCIHSPYWALPPGTPMQDSPPNTPTDQIYRPSTQLSRRKTPRAIDSIRARLFSRASVQDSPLVLEGRPSEEKTRNGKQTDDTLSINTLSLSDTWSLDL